jgi:organic hydroperoxide reductase OsmC/OhrA
MERKMQKIHEYETSVSWSAEQDGRIEASDLPTVSTAPPPEFGGPGGKWSPEHLFLSSANACVLFTFLAMAKFSKLDIAGWRSAARGVVEKVEGQGWLFTGIEIISNSMKTPVKFEVQVRPAVA